MLLEDKIMTHVIHLLVNIIKQKKATFWCILFLQETLLKLILIMIYINKN